MQSNRCFAAVVRRRRRHGARLGLGRGDRATFARGARVRCCVGGRVDARGSSQSRNRVSELPPKAEAPSKRIWGGTSDAPTWFFRRTPPFAFAQNPIVGIPETPPEPPFRIATQSGGVLVCETNQPISFRRSNGGDWTEALTRNRLEHSPLRRHYFNAGFIPANAKGGNR